MYCFTSVTSHKYGDAPRASKRRSGKARDRVRTPVVLRGSGTQPVWMQRRSNASVFMRRGTRKGGAFTVALMLLLAASVLAPSCGKVQEEEKEPYPVAALIAQAGGDMSIRTVGRDCWLSGDAGVSLFSGDTVNTGPDSGLTLILLDGTILYFGGGADFNLVTGHEGGDDVEITRGELWLESGKESKPPALITPAVTVTCSRSAENEFGITVEPGGATTVDVAGGSATVCGGAGTVTVEEGETSICGPGEAPSKEKAPEGVGSGAGGFPSFVDMLTDPYFSDEAARDNTESEAMARIDVAPLDAWAHLNLGRALLDADRVDEAGKEFEAALSLDPQFTQAYSGIGKLELMKDNWSQAMDAYSSARRADRLSLEAVFGMGQSALGEGDLGEAEKWYKEALNIEQEDDSTWVALGTVKFLKHDLEAALDDWKKAVSIDPLNTRAYAPMAYLYSIEQEADLAESYFEKALEVDPGDCQAWNSLGIQYVRQGLLEKAADCFRNQQEAGGKSTGYQNLGVVDRTRGEKHKALGNWEKARDLTPDRLSVSINLGEVHLTLGEDQQALELFTRAVQIDPGYWYPHQWLAMTYLAGGLFAEAQSESRESISLNPLDWASHVISGLALAGQSGQDTGESAAELEKGRELAGEELSPFGHALIGMSYQCEGEYTRALEQYRLAAELAPRESVYRRYSGDALLAADKEEEALEEYRKAIELNAADIEARLSVARILISRGDSADAALELERALEQEDDPALRCMLARCLLEEGNADGALEELESAMLIPGIPVDTVTEVLVLRGIAYDRQEEFEAAIAEYTRAVAENPARGDAWFYLAGDLERAGRVAEARDAYTRALELCSGNEQWREFATQSAEKLNQI